MKNFLLLLMCLIGGATLHAQILFQENFEGNEIPDGWSVETNATDGGWISGTANSLQSTSWPIEDNGSRIVASNDDGCNCDKSQDFLILPPMDFTDVEEPIIEFQLYYGEQAYQGAQEDAYIKVSTDNGSNWTIVEELNGAMGWQSVGVGLSDYAGMDDVLIAFHYDDNGGWLYGIAVDDVTIRVPMALDVELNTVDVKAFGETTDEFPIIGTLVNKGLNTINSFDVSYTVNGGDAVVATFDDVSIGSLNSYEFTHPEIWVPNTAGTYEIDITISNLNGEEEMNMDDNSLSVSVDVFEKVVIPNRVDLFLEGTPIIRPVASSSDDLDKPTDLDFFPILGKNELWVINERNEDIGGSTVTLYNAGKEDQETLTRVDGNAWHFMSLPTGIAFAENGFFGTSPGVLDANHSGGTFTGPTLWTSDPDIYARPSGGNGSHMDMLHGSPYSMGIAHEVDNVYWIFDGYNGHPVRYDFVEDHGPGAADHSDGRVRRYTEIELERAGDIPSHLILDKTTGWLYIADIGNKRVLRLNIESGSVMQQLNEINEPLAEHSEMHNVEWEEIITTGLDQPCGIEVLENRLLVSDYATGDIIIYDMNNDFEEMGRIATGQAGITGIKIGPEGNIWYTNRTANELNVIEPDEFSSTENILPNSFATIAPNPTSGLTTIQLTEATPGVVYVLDTNGRLIQQMAITSTNLPIDLSAYASGLYTIKIQTNDGVLTKRITVQK